MPEEESASVERLNNEALKEKIERFNKITGSSKVESGSLQTKLKETIKATLRKSFNIETVNTSSPTVSDYFLAITDCALNSTKFGISTKPKVKEFWEFVKEQSDYKKLFEEASAQLLLKHWANISNLDALKLVVALVCGNRKEVDKNCNELKNLINVGKKVESADESIFCELLRKEKLNHNRSYIRPVGKEKRLSKGNERMMTFNLLNPKGPLDTKFSRNESMLEDRLFKEEMEKAKVTDDTNG